VSKVLIVAPTKIVADMVAKEHNLRPWDWRYCFNAQSLMGRSPKDTVFIHNEWRDPTPDAKMTSELRLLRNIGVQIVMVST
jgi:hypothetical protein